MKKYSKKFVFDSVSDTAVKICNNLYCGMTEAEIHSAIVESGNEINIGNVGAFIWCKDIRGAYARIHFKGDE